MLSLPVAGFGGRRGYRVEEAVLVRDRAAWVYKGAAVLPEPCVPATQRRASLTKYLEPLPSRRRLVSSFSASPNELGGYDGDADGCVVAAASPASKLPPLGLPRRTMHANCTGNAA
jgi:hypothetical protein